MTCMCPQCSATPLPTWTPEWRLECEARWLLGKPIWVRKEYLDKPAVAQRAEVLKGEMLRLHRAAGAAR